jgi:single-strand DNA-binding protein
MSYTRTIIMGRLTRDPESVTTSTGKSLARFSVAVDRGYGDRKETDFYNCTSFEKTADALMDFTRKGDMVLVEGEMASRKYTNKEGVEVLAWELKAYKVDFSMNKRDRPSAAEAAPQDVKSIDEYDPFADE